MQNCEIYQQRNTVPTTVGDFHEHQHSPTHVTQSSAKFILQKQWHKMTHSELLVQRTQPLGQSITVGLNRHHVLCKRRLGLKHIIIQRNIQTNTQTNKEWRPNIKLLCVRYFYYSSYEPQPLHNYLLNYMSSKNFTLQKAKNSQTQPRETPEVR